MENDTVKLLRECDAGARMAVSSINEVMEEVRDSEMKEILGKSRKDHSRLGEDIDSLLGQYGAKEKEPPLMARGMSWMKTNAKMAMDPCDATAADLITDGCDMGVKSLNRYKNQYRHADREAVEICGRLISMEEKLGKAMQPYL